jgi:hypothetical protein
MKTKIANKQSDADPEVERAWIDAQLAGGPNFLGLLIRRDHLKANLRMVTALKEADNVQRCRTELQKMNDTISYLEKRKEELGYARKAE